jgi:Bacteriophage minor capsid protein
MMRADTGDVLIDAFANHLQSEGLGTLGTNLFVHRMPAEIKQGLLLINNAGGAMVDPYIPRYRRCRFRLIARGTSPSNAIGQINAVLPTLDAICGKIIDDTIEVKLLTRENDPVVFPASLGSNVLESTIALNAVYALL